MLASSGMGYFTFYSVTGVSQKNDQARRFCLERPFFVGHSSCGAASLGAAGVLTYHCCVILVNERLARTVCYFQRLGRVADKISVFAPGDKRI